MRRGRGGRPRKTNWRRRRGRRDSGNSARWAGGARTSHLRMHTGRAALSPGDWHPGGGCACCGCAHHQHAGPIPCAVRRRSRARWGPTVAWAVSTAPARAVGVLRVPYFLGMVARRGSVAMQSTAPGRCAVRAVFFRMLYLANEKRYGRSEPGFGVSWCAPAAQAPRGGAVCMVCRAVRRARAGCAAGWRVWRRAPARCAQEQRRGPLPSTAATPCPHLASAYPFVVLLSPLSSRVATRTRVAPGPHRRISQARSRSGTLARRPGWTLLSRRGGLLDRRRACGTAT